jgi:hypothetical protein
MSESGFRKIVEPPVLQTDGRDQDPFGSEREVRLSRLDGDGGERSAEFFRDPFGF